MSVDAIEGRMVSGTMRLSDCEDTDLLVFRRFH